MVCKTSDASTLPSRLRQAAHGSSKGWRRKLRTAKSCGPGARCSRQVRGGEVLPNRVDCALIRETTVTKRNSSPGRARRKPLKPFACGNAGLFRWTCGDYRVLTTNAHGLRVPLSTRHSPRPQGAERICKTRAQCAARSRRHGISCPVRCATWSASGMMRCRPGTQEAGHGKSGPAWVPAQGRDTGAFIQPFPTLSHPKLVHRGTPDALAFTIAPHLQIINYRGRFWGFAGI
jgi:hypothetical protein